MGVIYYRCLQVATVISTADPANYAAPSVCAAQRCAILIYREDDTQAITPTITALELRVPPHSSNRTSDAPQLTGIDSVINAAGSARLLYLAKLSFTAQLDAQRTISCVFTDVVLGRIKFHANPHSDTCQTTMVAPGKAETTSQPQAESQEEGDGKSSETEEDDNKPSETNAAAPKEL